MSSSRYILYVMKIPVALKVIDNIFQVTDYLTMEVQYLMKRGSTGGNYTNIRKLKFLLYHRCI